MAITANSTVAPATQSASEAIFDIENEVREARYLSDALVSLAEDMTSSRNAVAYLASEVRQRVQRLESAWEQAFSLTRAH